VRVVLGLYDWTLLLDFTIGVTIGLYYWTLLVGLYRLILLFDCSIELYLWMFLLDFNIGLYC